MKPKTLKDKTLGVRIDADTVQRLEEFQERTGVEPVTLTRNAMLAALDYFEEHGTIVFPIRMVTALDP